MSPPESLSLCIQPHCIITIDNEDFEVFNATIMFPVNSSSGDVMCFDVVLLEDDILEGNESVVVSIESDVATVDNSSSLVLAIQDLEDLVGKGSLESSISTRTLPSIVSSE